VLLWDFYGDGSAWEGDFAGMRKWVEIKIFKDIFRYLSLLSQF
jgi:hypothetical protein